jgi:hypothetical protein
VRLRGQLALEDPLPQEADFVEIGWPCITTCLKNGADVAKLPVSACKSGQQQAQVLIKRHLPNTRLPACWIGW